MNDHDHVAGYPMPRPSPQRVPGAARTPGIEAADQETGSGSGPFSRDGSRQNIIMDATIMDQPKAAPTHEATSPSASPDAESWGSIPTLGRFAHLDRVRYPHDLRNLS
ncbi:hypothetical protein CFR71_05985, partial [Novacetimonas pomaceti]